MKVGIVGGRGFNDQVLFDNTLTAFTIEHGKITHVVSGAAKGADTMGANFAKRFGIELTEFIPEWDKYGRSAGFRRNQDIIANSEYVIAFWDGSSKGTKSSIDLAKKLNIPILVVYYTPLSTVYVERKGL